MIQAIGQQKIISQLIAFEKDNKTPHALMISGQSGRGALAIAIFFSQYLLCSGDKTDKPCGSCPNCQKTSKLIHPDLHFSFPVVKYKTKKRDATFSDDFINDWRKLVLDSPYFSYTRWLDHIDAAQKQGDINVKECNEVSKKLSLKSFAGGKKILILWLAEYLGKNANRLLKIIEEPPEDTHIIFITHDEQSLLKTIISRFQIIKLPPIDAPTLASALSLKFSLPEDKAMRIAQLSEGDYLDAVSMISGENENVSEIVLRWFRMCYQQKASQLSAWTEEFGSFTKEFQKQVLSYALFILREFLKYAHLGQQSLSISPEEFEKLKGLSKVLNLEKAEQIASILNDAEYAIQRNANVRVMMMADSLEIGRVLRN